MRLFLSRLLVSVAAVASFAASRSEVVPTKFPATPGTFRSTNPKPQHLQATPRPDIPGIDVPVEAAEGTWKVTDTVNGKKVSTGPIRVFAFDDGGTGSKVGEIAAGTVVSLKSMRRVNGAIFYAIPFEGKTAWINGYFLERGGVGSQNPPAAK